MFSLDVPKTGSGDHENVYGVYKQNLEIYDFDDEWYTKYSNCTRLAFNIRAIQTHVPWHSLQTNIFFSDLTGLKKQYIEITNKADPKKGLNKDLEEARNAINYTIAVNSSYGYEATKFLILKFDNITFIIL